MYMLSMFRTLISFSAVTDFRSKVRHRTKKNKLYYYVMCSSALLCCYDKYVGCIYVLYNFIMSCVYAIGDKNSNTEILTL